MVAVYKNIVISNHNYMMNHDMTHIPLSIIL